MRSLFFCSFLLFAVSGAYAQETPTNKNSFTGRVTKDRVRLRLQPNLESHIYKELNKGDYVLVCGQSDEFYAVMPPKEVPAYIFRTYVLDGAVEGSNVNVRLEPDTGAPTLCQLQSGQKVQGEIASKNNKWLKIALPQEVRFWIAKDFVTKIGDAALFREHEIKQTHVQEALNKITPRIDSELQKPFGQISLGQFTAELQQLILTSDDLPKEQERARELLASMQKEYLAKSISSQTVPKAIDEKKAVVIEIQEQKPSEQPTNGSGIANYWIEKEHALIQDAIARGDVESAEDFYNKDQKATTSISGVIKPYNAFIKNRPGDFILINPTTNLPIAYLYSTKINLDTYVNRTVSLSVAKRPNNNFAFRAYYVFSAKES